MGTFWPAWSRWFVGAAALAVAAANLAAAGKVRDTPGYQALRAVEAAGSERPMILLVGSSLTQHGIDKALLQSELARRGLDVEVASLAFGGMIKTERHFYLREMGRLVGTRPAAVLFETSAEYDWRPFYTLARNARSGRLVVMMDWRSALEAMWWPLWYSWGDQFDAVRDLVVRHYVSLSAMLDAAPFSALPAHDQTTGDLSGHAPGFTPSFYAANRHQGAPESLWRRLGWAWWQAERMAETAREIGAREVAFYGMPRPGPIEPRYWRLLCEHRPDCIVPDEGLIRRLDDYELWYDEIHLLPEGRQSFTLWFAERLAERLRQHHAIPTGS